LRVDAGRRGLRRRAASALAAALLCVAASSPAAWAAPRLQPSAGPSARPPSEDEVSAAFLLNFLRYTDWPPRSFATADAPYVIAVVGNESVATHVRAVVAAAGRINGRPVEVRWVSSARGTRAAPFDSAQDRENQSLLRRSHLVFFHSSAGNIPAQALSDLWSQPVLTVSDVPDFTRAGGMLGLVRQAGHIAFEANPVAIRNARLMLSAKVLKLARLTGGPRS
jgi:hypothetical protein